MGVDWRRLKISGIEDLLGKGVFCVYSLAFPADQHETNSRPRVITL